MTGRQLWIATSLTCYTTIDCPADFTEAQVLNVATPLAADWAPTRARRLTDEGFYGHAYVIGRHGDVFATARTFNELEAHRRAVELFGRCQTCKARVTVGHTSHDAGIGDDGTELFTCGGCCTHCNGGAS